MTSKERFLVWCDDRCFFWFDDLSDLIRHGRDPGFPEGWKLYRCILLTDVKT
jgi:hypothetical protein